MVASGPDPALAAAVVVFAHGITANHKAWALVTPRLDACVATLAVDLRGRGGSVGLPGPYGMAAHADDIASVLNYVGVDDCFIVGHSMGCFVASTFGVRFADRLLGAVLVDGGVALRRPADVDPANVVEAVIGPAMHRLRQTFRSRADYQEVLASTLRSPATASGTGQSPTTSITTWAAASLVSRAGSTRLRSARMAQEVLLDPTVIDAASFLECPTELIRVERGVLNEPTPLITAEVAAALGHAERESIVTTAPGPQPLHDHADATGSGRRGGCNQPGVATVDWHSVSPVPA
ncbi:MAG: alpha/beta hydrolase [Acidimicrobiales bacterium]